MESHRIGKYVGRETIIYLVKANVKELVGELKERGYLPASRERKPESTIRLKKKGIELIVGTNLSKKSSDEINRAFLVTGNSGYNAVLTLNVDDKNLGIPRTMRLYSAQKAITSLLHRLRVPMGFFYETGVRDLLGFIPYTTERPFNFGPALSQNQILHIAGLDSKETLDPRYLTVQ